MCYGQEVSSHELKSRQHKRHCIHASEQNILCSSCFKKKTKRLTQEGKPDDWAGEGEHLWGHTLGQEAFARWKRVVPSTFHAPQFNSCFREVQLRILYHKSDTTNTEKDAFGFSPLFCRQNLGASSQAVFFFCSFVSKAVERLVSLNLSI